MLNCWICELPVGVSGRDPDDLIRSHDHVIPRKFGGGFLNGNIRWAHRWCNSRRGHKDVTDEMKQEFRNRLWRKHTRWFEKKLQHVPEGNFQLALKKAGLRERGN